jgi:hypothetical protein
MINLQQVIDDQLKLENINENRVPMASPSNLGNCLRKHILRENNYPHTELEARQLRVFRVGYLFEDFVTRTLEKSGLLYAKQIKVNYRGVYGTLDFLLIDEVSKEIIIADCKSVHSGKFDYLDSEVDRGYAMQQTCYYLGLKEAIDSNNFKIPDGYTLSDTVWLFYVEKECLLTKQIAVNTALWTKPVDQQIFDIERARTIYIDKKELPVEKERDWECFSVQKSRAKNPKILGVKVWCPYISNCPNKCAELEATKKQIQEVVK